MKKIALFLMMFVTMFLTAQNVTLYGVDYSCVNVIGADEPDEGFIKDFKKINDVIFERTSFYKIDKYLGLNVTSKSVDVAKKRTDILVDRKFRNLTDNEIDLDKIISGYPETEGDVLLFVCKELNKSSAIGIHEVVVFDGKTKKILKSKEIKCAPYGYGMATYWNYTIMVGLKNAKDLPFKEY